MVRCWALRESRVGLEFYSIFSFKSLYVLALRNVFMDSNVVGPALPARRSSSRRSFSSAAGCSAYWFFDIFCKRGACFYPLGVIV
jgi:hypothetical protein